MVSASVKLPARGFNAEVAEQPRHKGAKVLEVTAQRAVFDRRSARSSRHITIEAHAVGTLLEL